MLTSTERTGRARMAEARCGMLCRAMADRDFRIEDSELRADDEFAEFSSTDLPYYSDWRGSFEKLPWATDDEALAAANADVAIVGAPLDDAVSSRPGARFGPRAIRMAPTAWSTPIPRGRSSSDVEPYAGLKVVDAGDAPVVPARLERGLRVIHEKVFRVASAGPIPIVLGGDHSITYPSAAAVARHQHPRTVGIVHFDAHADTGAEQWGNAHGHGTPMRQLIDEGWVAGANFVQVGLRGYWPERATFDWMREQGLRWHTMVEIEDRGAEAVIADAIARGAGRPRLHLPVGRHRRRRSGHGARHRHAGARRACSRASCCERSARSWVRSTSWGWTWSRSPPYDTPR